MVALTASVVVIVVCGSSSINIISSNRDSYVLFAASFSVTVVGDEIM